MITLCLKIVLFSCQNRYILYIIYNYINFEKKKKKTKYK